MASHNKNTKLPIHATDAGCQEREETTVQQEEKPFCFLNLPPELRNRIYSFTEEVPQDERNRVTHLRRKTDISTPTSPDSMADSKPFTRQFFGLTQVCHLIRVEFRPLYMRLSEVWLLPEEVPPYLKTYILPFWPKKGFSDKSSTPAANLVVDMKPTTKPKRGEMMDQCKGFDTMLLWSLMVSLTRRFACSANEWLTPEFNLSIAADMNKLIYHHLDSWRRYYRHLKSMKIYTGLDPYSRDGHFKALVVVFRSSFKVNGDVGENEAPPKLLKFMRTFGFGPDSDFKILLMEVDRGDTWSWRGTRDLVRIVRV